MQSILIATVTVGAIGLLIGLLLIMVDKKFKVEVDEKELAVRSYLPGNNCGACGFAGCDALAAAIAKGEAPVNSCPVGGESVANDIGQVMGVEAEVTDKKVAFVKCSGSCSKAVQKCNYVGIHDCASAAAAGISPWACDYGCFGFGSCAAVCPFNAIQIIDGVAVVDRTKCKACTKCVAVCPKHLIEIIPDDSKYAVACSNKDRGPAVKKVCSSGCIGCKLCEKQCEDDAIHVTDNVAAIDYDKCKSCGKCVEKCPAKSIEARF